ncbi:hypothetical protein GCM10011575_31350 [Microlunatus endophyticus]|uniref:Uncharacterized protein n=1 Tax=Microlunatus endophyticus TaxID=1716077 RepID=A0A917W6Z1_9ACTN|nr:hypothetical protein [Microlunatus endophyticus]GGL70615.1 hypothetical protein GCM10011575_31350 [Microlunatus endophyticus]
MGENPDQWWTLMTEPVTFSLNVAELIENPDLHPGLAGLDEAEDKLDASFSDCADQDQMAEAHDAALTGLNRRYTDGYALYAERFVTAVKSAATDLGLPLPPRVVVDDDPQSAWWDDGAIRNSANTDSALVIDLWERAHAIVPLPNVDIRLDPPEPTKGG